MVSLHQLNNEQGSRQVDQTYLDQIPLDSFENRESMSTSRGYQTYSLFINPKADNKANAADNASSLFEVEFDFVLPDATICVKNLALFS